MFKKKSATFPLSTYIHDIFMLLPRPHRAWQQYIHTYIHNLAYIHTYIHRYIHTYIIWHFMHVSVDILDAINSLREILSFTPKKYFLSFTYFLQIPTIHNKAYILGNWQTENIKPYIAWIRTHNLQFGRQAFDYSCTYYQFPSINRCVKNH
jgi:hypothetical protein